MIAALVIAACSENWGDNAYIVEGTIVEVRPPSEVVVQHEAIKGLMDAMTMPFEVRDPALFEGLVPGDRIYARLILDQSGSHLEAVRVTGKRVLPPPVETDVVDVLRVGEVLPSVSIPVDDGSTWTIGEGQGQPTAVAFLYTRCPMPEFCPALVGKFLALQPLVGDRARLLTVTLDPEHDTLAVLGAYGASVGADPAVWRFGRVEQAELVTLAGRAALGVDRSGKDIVHGARMWVLDAEGRLIERYDDNRFPVERVAEQLRTGLPAAPAGSDGTISP